LYLDEKNPGPAATPPCPILRGREAPSLRGFVAWLEAQPPGATYNYWNTSGQCCVGQYIAHLGYDWSRDYAVTSVVLDSPLANLSLPPWDTETGNNERTGTFGHVLEKARATQALGVDWAFTVDQVDECWGAK